VSVTRTIIGRLIVGHEKARQHCPGGDALSWENVEPQEWCLAHHKGEVSRHVVFIASRGACRNAAHLEPYTWVRATVSHQFFEEKPSASHMCARISLHTYDRQKE
jgi:hypothetical protein